jgi:CheY-like chemotaxis protein
VLLPAREGRAVARPERQVRRSVRASAHGCILVIDDEDLARDTTRAMLEECGYLVYRAASGREGVEIYRRQHERVDCVILDLTMPAPDGAATLAQLTTIDPYVRVVVMSGYDPSQAMTRIARSQRTQFLRKPFTLEQLQDALAAVSG